MNTEQYHKLMQKFLDGDTNVSEESTLKNSEFLSEEDAMYFEVVTDEKQEKSNLNFSEFLKLAEKEDKIIPLPVKTSNFKWVWLAAGLVLMFSLGLIYFNTTNQNNTVVPQVATTEIYQQEKSEILVENQYEVESDIVENSEKQVASADKILDQILPKKSRMKKVNSIRYVDHKTTKQKSEIPEYESNYVIINGQKITNEQDAIDITKYSFQVLANNVNQSMQQAEVLQSLNFNN